MTYYIVRSRKGRGYLSYRNGKTRWSRSTSEATVFGTRQLAQAASDKETNTTVMEYNFNGN